MRCKNCHYSLANLTEHRCPECGNAFDPNDPTTFEHKGNLRFGSALIRKLLLVWAIASVGVLAIGLITEQPWPSPVTLILSSLFCGSVLTFLLVPLLLMMSDLGVRRAQMDFDKDQDE